MGLLFGLLGNTVPGFGVEDTACKLDGNRDRN